MKIVFEMDENIWASKISVDDKVYVVSSFSVEHFGIGNFPVTEDVDVEPNFDLKRKIVVNFPLDYSGKVIPFSENKITRLDKDGKTFELKIVEAITGKNGFSGKKDNEKASFSSSNYDEFLKLIPAE